MSPWRARLGLGLAAALVAAAGPLETAPAAADGGADEVPAGATTETRLRLALGTGPRSSDPGVVRAWSASMAAEGRARAGTDLGGDLLAGAASALEARGLDRPAALALVKEAAAAYPPGHAAVGFAWFERAVLEARSGDAVSALASLDEARRLAFLPAPTDDPPDEAARRLALRGQVEGLGGAWRADLLGALGRHAEATDLLEAAAARETSGSVDRAWERAARSAWCAGDRERALRDAERAIGAARDDGRVADLEQWRLLARHGLLAPNGDVQLTSAWPGEAFLEDARGTLRGLEGRRGAWKVAVQVAALAWAAGRAAEALEMYAAAFRDPAFEEAARASPFARQRLVTAAWLALRAKDPRRARLWLERAAQYAGGPVPGSEGLRLAVDEALAESEGAAAPDVPGGEAPSPGEPTPRRGRGLLEVPGDGAGPEGPAAGPEGAKVAREGGAGSWLRWAAAGLVLAAAAAVGVARRRRRAGGRRPRP